MSLKKALIIGFFFSQLLCIAQDYSAELILQETSIVIDKNILTKDVYFEIRINNRAGEKQTKIGIPYSKLNKLSNIDAYIKDANGEIIKKLKKSDIIDRSSFSSSSFYEDSFVKEFTLKHNSYPYTIVYSYQIQQKEFLYIENWIPIIDEKIPTLTAKLNVSVPLNYTIAYRNRYVEEPTIETQSGRVAYQWKTSYTDIIKPEVYSPPILSLVPYVSITPKEFTFDKKGSFQDWVSYGNWQHELLQGLNELPHKEKRKILSLIENIEDDKEKIKIVYHYLQDETRYINITIETGGLRPYPASYVAQNKYGDCKALTNYFKSVLDFLEIPSYYTKIYAGSPIKEIDEDFPSQQFNHAILYIPQKGEDIWLDCTSDGAFDYLGTFTQNRNAFIIDNDNSTFKKTPKLTPIEVLDTRKIEITYNPLKSMARFHNTYKGDSYETILQLEKGYNESEKSKIMRNYIVADGFQLIDFKLPKPHRDSLNIDLSYNATTHNIYKHYGNDVLINNIAFTLPDFEKPTSRKFPVQFDYPVYKTDTITYEVPVGYKLQKSQESYTVQNKYGEYKFNIYEIDKKIMIVKSVLFNAGYYPVSEYSEFHDFYQKVIDIENKTHISLYK